jgi:predicted ATPase/DNA-binding SARP family transcriptional activator
MPDVKASLRVEALGQMRVFRGPVLIDLGPTKQRAVFAMLAVHAGEAVSMEAMLDAVWGTSAPTSARHLVHTYVARLRQVLEPEMPRRARVNVIGSTSSGYRLLIDLVQIDLVRFRRLVAQAKQHMSIGEHNRAFDLLGEAVRLWRDPMLTELSALLSGSPEVDLLRQAWTYASLDYVALGLQLGEGPAVLVHAQRLAAAEPMHEEAQARYIAVLEQTGQRAAAIEHFSDLRARLSDELGVEPGPQLSGAYRQLLLGTQSRPAAPTYAGSIVVPARPPWRGPGPGLGDLVQRGTELTALAQILSVERLLTLAGPPGCGKSAVALHTAAGLRDAFLGGVAVVDCSEVSDIAGLKARLLDLLGASEGADLAKVLGEQQILIVLDNIEPLVDPCAVVVDGIVRGCRHVSVLVTSREPLGLPDETVWRLSTLAVPDVEGWPGDNPSVRLFVRRAAQVNPGFRLGPDNVHDVSTICRRLDGLPLALEMAAACLATDTLEGVVRRLDDPLNLIRPPRRGPPAHHRSLWAALRRSLDCLTELERWCFIQLGNVPAQFGLWAAQQAWAAAPWRSVDVRGVLTRLVDKSLLYVQHGSDGPTYQMLWLIHRFAADLATAEAV